MNKYTTTVFLIALIVSVGFVSCKLGATKSAYEYAEGVHSFEIITNNVGTDYGTFIVNYPKFDGNSNRKLNTYIKNVLQNEAASILHNAKLSCTGKAANDNKMNTFEITFDVFSNDKELISLRFNIFSDWSELFYPDLYFISVNYNPETENYITLEQLYPEVTPIIGLKKHLTQLAYEAAKQKTDYYAYFRDENNELSAYANFNLENDTLIINIDDYSVEYFSCYSIQLEIPLVGSINCEKCR